MELGQRNGEFLSELSFSETVLWSCGTTPLSFLDLSFPEDTWESLLQPEVGCRRRAVPLLRQYGE